ncbi:MAG: PqqD family peptide modification chaperone [Gemmataceae bacterium]|nr:PqqD family peptide modification chaperone [Gemmataceae bacterium]
MANLSSPLVGERFALALCGDGGVLLDSRSGAFCRLNATAAHICADLIRGGSPQEAAHSLARRFSITPAAAARDVATILGSWKAPPVEWATENPISFDSGPSGHTLRWNGLPTWRLSPDGTTLTRQARHAEPDPVTQLLWVVPHVLILRGQLVLHASAVEREGSIMAFAGPSGQGKTTLANLFGRQGSPVVSEDLLLVKMDRSIPEAIVGGERAIRSWVNAQVSGAAGDVIRTEGLVEACRGPRLPLADILFPVREEVSVPALVHRPLDAADALVQLMQNSFAELGQPAVWQQLFEANHRLVQTTHVNCLCVPEGLGPLTQAIANYRGSVDAKETRNNKLNNCT